MLLVTPVIWYEAIRRAKCYTFLLDLTVGDGIESQKIFTFQAFIPLNVYDEPSFKYSTDSQCLATDNRRKIYFILKISVVWAAKQIIEIQFRFKIFVLNTNNFQKSDKKCSKKVH